MDYNTSRTSLPLPKYGRYIQSMVDYCLTIADRDERTHCAATIVRLMGAMFPSDGNGEAADKVRWDHLALMAGYKLDVDFPYSIPTAAEAAERPSAISYPAGRMRFRHYGTTIERLIRVIADMPEGEERTELIGLTAQQMATDLYYWNRDAVSPRKIADDIRDYSGGRLEVDPDTLVIERPVDAPATGKHATGRKRNQKKY